MWCTGVSQMWITGSCRALFVRTGKHQMAVYRTVALNLWGECTGCCSAVVSGVVGSKDKFSLVETWYICDTLLRGVGILKLSLPLS